MGKNQGRKAQKRYSAQGTSCVEGWHAWLKGKLPPSTSCMRRDTADEFLARCVLWWAIGERDEQGRLARLDFKQVEELAELPPTTLPLVGEHTEAWRLALLPGQARETAQEPRKGVKETEVKKHFRDVKTVEDFHQAVLKSGMALYLTRV